mgnify:CR=1 FL=1
MTFPSKAIIAGFSCALVLTGCGGGSSNGGGTTSQFGDLNLSVTDAPVDGASVVNVQFDSITVKHKNNDPESLDSLEVTNINLLDYTGGTSRILLQTEGNTSLKLRAGEYNWIRFDVSASIDSTLDSYITIDGSQYELEVPSSTGLKLNTGFTIPVDGVANFTVDFDLRHSIIGPFTKGADSYYKLKPVLRLVDNTTVGTLSGAVASGLISSCDGVNDMPAVYLFEGSLTGEQLDDMDIDVDGVDADDSVEPLATVSVPTDGGGDYNYTIGFVNEGSYTVAFTCDEDDPASDDDATLSFSLDETLSIIAEQTTIKNFSLAL